MICRKNLTIHNDLKTGTYNGGFTDAGGNTFAHDNGLGQPWWYKKAEKTSQPTYAMINITYDTITVTSKVIKNVLLSDVNKNVTIQPFGEQTIEQHDQLVINYSDRS